MNVSKAGVGMYASVITVVLTLLGVDVDEGQVTEAVLGAATVVSFVVWLYGQFARTDLEFGLFRK